MNNRSDAAGLFHSLHTSSSPLALANVWDAASARLVEDAGAPAIATTSAGMSWAIGRPDGDALTAAEAVAALARIVDAVRIPVSADIESGYAATADGVARTVAAVIDAGAVGINLEDGGTAPVETAARLRAAREAADRAGVRLFVNARTDVYLAGIGDPDDRLAETLSRASRYLDAGADGIFVPGVGDEETVRALVDGIDAPLNVMAGAGSPSVARFGGWGVARVSLGSGVAQAAYAVAHRAARDLLSDGTYDALAPTVEYATMNELSHWKSLER